MHFRSRTLFGEALDATTPAEVTRRLRVDAEGKITLPVLLAYRRGNAEEQEFWRKAMEGDSADEQALAEAMELLAKHGAIPDTVARARHYGEMARDALAPLPAGSYKDALLEVVEFCVSRVS